MVYIMKKTYIYLSILCLAGSVAFAAEGADASSGADFSGGDADAGVVFVDVPEEAPAASARSNQKRISWSGTNRAAGLYLKVLGRVPQSLDSHPNTEEKVPFMVCNFGAREDATGVLRCDRLFYTLDDFVSSLEGVRAVEPDMAVCWRETNSSIVGEESVVMKNYDGPPPISAAADPILAAAEALIVQYFVKQVIPNPEALLAFFPELNSSDLHALHQRCLDIIRIIKQKRSFLFTSSSRQLFPKHLPHMCRLVGFVEKAAKLRTY